MSNFKPFINFPLPFFIPAYTNGKFIPTSGEHGFVLVFDIIENNKNTDIDFLSLIHALLSDKFKNLKHTDTLQHKNKILIYFICTETINVESAKAFQFFPENLVLKGIYMVFSEESLNVYNRLYVDYICNHKHIVGARFLRFQRIVEKM